LDGEPPVGLVKYFRLYDGVFLHLHCKGRILMGRVIF